MLLHPDPFSRRKIPKANDIGCYRLCDPNFSVPAAADTGYVLSFIVRLYEAEGTYTNVTLSTDMKISSMKICDMLENEQEDTDGNLSFRPFEIKTLKLSY